jgi:hypothetical protein
VVYEYNVLQDGSTIGVSYGSDTTYRGDLIEKLDLPGTP